MCLDFLENMAEVLQVNWRYAPGPGDAGKYKLRVASRSRKRGEVVEGEEEAGRVRRTKGKTGGGQKMSKYRRKTANARERMRMGEINSAFEKLKEKIPLPTVGLGRQKCEKLTKINLLHIAINYIRTLEDILDTGRAEVDIFPEKLILNPFQEPEEEMEEEEDDEDEEEEGGDNSYSPVPSLIASLKREDSSSPDSGIQEDSEPEFPDWTQLSSTLDLRSGGELGERAAPRKVTLPKTPLPPDAFKLHFAEKVTKSKPVTLTSRSSPSTVTPTSPLTPAPLLLHCKTAALLYPCSKEEMLDEEGEEDIFPDICGPFDTTFTGLGGIDFAYDDPFKVF